MKENILMKFAEWHDEQCLPGESCFTIGEDCENRSASIDIDTPKLMGRIIYWSSNDYAAEIIETNKGKVVYWKYGSCHVNNFSSEFSEFLKILENWNIWRSQ